MSQNMDTHVTYCYHNLCVTYFLLYFSRASSPNITFRGLQLTCLISEESSCFAECMTQTQKAVKKMP